MNARLQATADRAATLLSLLVSLFLALAGATVLGRSPYLLVLGVTGAIGFGMIALHLVHGRPWSPGDRLAAALVAAFVGVLSGSVVLLPLMLIPTAWFLATAVATRD